MVDCVRTYIWLMLCFSFTSHLIFLTLSQIYIVTMTILCNYGWFSWAFDRMSQGTLQLIMFLSVITKIVSYI